MEYTYISGATGGIGKAFTKECAKKGYNLFLTARSQQKLELLKSEIEKEYKVDILTFACDLTDENQRQDMVEYAVQKGIEFNRIINVAGVDTQKAFMDYTLEKVLFQMRVNVESTISLTHLLLLHRAQETQVITISSMSGASPMPYFALYSATKCMLTNFFTSLHYELKKSAKSNAPNKQTIFFIVSPFAKI